MYVDLLQEKATEYRRPEPPPRPEPEIRRPHHHQEVRHEPRHEVRHEARRGTDDEWDSSEGGHHQTQPATQSPYDSRHGRGGETAADQRGKSHQEGKHCGVVVRALDL